MMEKRRQVEEVTLALADKCSAMSVLELVLEFRDMHEFYKLPVWLHDEESGNILAGIISRSALNVKKLSIVEANLLVGMLLWPEVQDQKDNSLRLAILRVLKEKSSFHAIFATLKQHLHFVGSLYVKELAGSRRCIDLKKELELIRELFLKCGGSKETLDQSRKIVVAFPAK